MNPGNDKDTIADRMFLSVVTPVYNAAGYLPALYATLRAQTHTAWEWVVVDDGSTDGSGEMLRGWAAADDRIRCYACSRSGSAKYPRDMGIVMACSRFVVCIDADDGVAPDYLEKLAARQAATGAGIVYAAVRFVMPDGECTGELPLPGFDRTQVYAGRSLVCETIPIWRIGCNGLYDKSLFTNLSYPVRKADVWMNSDEVDERITLINAKAVAFADTTYFYINRSESVTSGVSPRFFDKLKTDRALLSLIVSEYGRGSEEHSRMSRQLFCNFRSCLAVYAANRRSLGADGAAIYADLKENYRLIEPSCLSPAERIKFLGLVSFRLLHALFHIKYSLLAGEVKSRLAPSSVRQQDNDTPAR